MAESTYLTHFHRHARQSLPQWQYTDIHKKARAKAGGDAPKPRRVLGSVSFDKGIFDEEDARAWLDANGYDGDLVDGGDAWTATMVPGVQSKRTTSTDTGVMMEFGHAPEVAAITKAFQRIAKALTPSGVHVDVPLGSRRRRRKRKRRAAADGYSAMAKRIVLADSELMRGKPAMLTKSLTGPYVLAPDREGLDVHVGGGLSRAPGHLGLDIVAFDHATVPHDLALGLPLPDGCARGVRICKSIYRDPTLGIEPERLTSEAARVLEPGGVLVTDGPAPNDPRMVPMGEGAWLRVEPVPSMRRALALAEVHKPGQEASPPDDKTVALIRKALAPGRVTPIATAQKRIVYSVVLEPEKWDGQDQIIDPHEIEAAAHHYISKSRVVNSGHTKSIQAEPVESFIAPMDMTFDGGPYGHQVVTKGSWVLGVKIHDPAEWAKVERGEYSGFSVGGFGLLSDAE